MADVAAVFPDDIEIIEVDFPRRLHPAVEKCRVVQRSVVVACIVHIRDIAGLAPVDHIVRQPEAQPALRPAGGVFLDPEVAAGVFDLDVYKRQEHGGPGGGIGPPYKNVRPDGRNVT